MQMEKRILVSGFGFITVAQAQKIVAYHQAKAQEILENAVIAIEDHAAIAAPFIAALKRG